MQSLPSVGSSVSIPPAQNILDALTLAVALLDANGTIITVNEGWREFARANQANRPDHFIGSNYLDVCSRVRGVEGASARAAAEGIRAVLDGEKVFSLEYSCHSPAEKRWFQLRASRLEHAGAVYAIVAHHDITTRVLAEQERQALLAKAQQTAERQQLLIRELHHRVRNTLAIVQALLGATARSASTIGDFYRSFTARITSLATTQTLLTEDYWQTASLRRMLEQELRPFLEGDQRRFLLKGPAVELCADLAVPLGMAMHELTTNAARHGALSVGTGWVEVNWDVRDIDGVRKLHLAWTEHDGPPVVHPQRTGFGSTVLERALAMQVKADVTFSYDRTGLRVQIAAPLIEQRTVPEY